MQVLPTAPSPTVTHLMNREALIGGADVDLLFSSLILVREGGLRPHVSLGRAEASRPAGRS